MQLFIANKEKVPDWSFVTSYQREKTKERMGLVCDVSAHKLLRDAFGHPQDISRVVVVVPH